MTWLHRRYGLRRLPAAAGFAIWVLLSSAAPAEALARPMEPAHGASLGKALISGVGSPICVSGALLVLSCIAMSLVSRRGVWRVAAGVGGAVTIGFALMLARASGGHTLATRLTLLVGVAGLIVPALGAAMRLGAQVASQSSSSRIRLPR